MYIPGVDGGLPWRACCPRLDARTGLERRREIAWKLTGAPFQSPAETIVKGSWNALRRQSSLGYMDDRLITTVNNVFNKA